MGIPGSSEEGQSGTSDEDLRLLQHYKFRSRTIKVLVTGTAGFIGFHLARRYAGVGAEVICIDNINDYYDPQLKLARLKELGITDPRDKYNIPVESLRHRNLVFQKLALEDRMGILHLFQQHRFDCVIHLAAQAGVRYSLEHPESYIESNIIGFHSILEACRTYHVRHLLYASSSSVYGLNRIAPFSEIHTTDHPASIYAATKKSNELMAHSYSHLFRLPVTGLRFFTVYGPWGRPDMAYYSFTEKILRGQPIDMYNFGKMRRDFTYVDDVVEGILKLAHEVPKPTEPPVDHNLPTDRSSAPFRIYNIGNHTPIGLEEFVSVLEDIIGRKAERRYLPMQPGDVLETYADIGKLQTETAFKPTTDLRSGLRRFVEWFREYHRIPS